MHNFTKISVYNRYDHSTLVPAYLNINHIVAINEITDKEETGYMVYLIDNSFRMPKESYDFLVNLIYGKEPENA